MKTCRLIAVLLLFFPFIVIAQVNKCKQADDSYVFQDTPCQLTPPVSQSMPSATQSMPKVETSLSTGADKNVNLFRALLSSAERGDVRSSQRVAQLYEFGIGTPKNDVEAVRWYRLAAEHGDAEGQEALGVDVLWRPRRRSGLQLGGELGF